ncbi:MAG: hypothetical protein ACOYN6_07785 [Ignavibacteria bacterium]
MVFNFLDLKETNLSCPECGWKGIATDTKKDDGLSDYGEVLLCPLCGFNLGFADYPTLKDKIDRNIADVFEQKIYQLGIDRKASFEKNKLKDISQLKDINDNNIYLVWTFAGKGKYIETLCIMYHEEIIWEELAWFECYERFIEIAKILKTKYGVRLKDLIPSDNSYTYLYGDNFNADDIINKTRKQIRDNTLSES